VSLAGILTGIGDLGYEMIAVRKSAFAERVVLFEKRGVHECLEQFTCENAAHEGVCLFCGESH
jgi:hypothetical protein